MKIIAMIPARYSASRFPGKLMQDLNGKPVITGLKRGSKPGCRIYVGADKIPRVLDGLGVAVLSTSKGVISNKTAIKFNIGGELICQVS